MADAADSKLSLAPFGTQIGFALTTVSSGACTCMVAGIPVAVRTVSGLTVAVGDSLLIMRHGSQRFAIQKLLAPPPVPPPPPPPPVYNAPALPTPPVQDPTVSAKAVTTTGTLVIPAVQTGTFRAGVWRTDLGPVNATDTIEGSGYSMSGVNTGVAFYGTKAQSLTGATVTQATVRVTRLEQGFDSDIATFRLVSQTLRPAGAPTLNETLTAPSIEVDDTKTVTLPAAWGQAIVDGTRGGIAVDNGGTNYPYMTFAGIGTSSAAWTLTLYWRR